MLASGHPSLAALESSNGAPRSAELELARFRAQAAVVRALTEQIDHCERAGEADGLSEQLVEEMNRLGLFEAAASSARLSLPEDSDTCSRHSASAPDSSRGFVAR